MSDSQINLAEEIKAMRRKRGITHADFEMATGWDYDAALGTQGGDKIIEKTAENFIPDSLRVLSQIIPNTVQIMSDKLLSFLNSEDSITKKTKEINPFLLKFEISAYLIFLADVFSDQHQTPDARKEIFYVVSSEILNFLQKISPEYQEADFNKNLYKRMGQYSEYIRVADSTFKLPREVEIWYAFRKNLTKATVQDTSLLNEYGHTDFLVLAYGMECQPMEKNFRITINNLFSSNKDIRDLSIKDFDKIIEKSKNQIEGMDSKNDAEQKPTSSTYILDKSLSKYQHIVDYFTFGIEKDDWIDFRISEGRTIVIHDGTIFYDKTLGDLGCPTGAKHTLYSLKRTENLEGGTTWDVEEAHSPYNTRLSGYGNDDRYGESKNGEITHLEQTKSWIS